MPIVTMNLPCYKPRIAFSVFAAVQHFIVLSTLKLSSVLMDKIEGLQFVPPSNVLQFIVSSFHLA